MWELIYSGRYLQQESYIMVFLNKFQVEEQIELSFGKITSWFAANPLVSNVKKTNLVKFQQGPPISKDSLTVSVFKPNI